MDAIISFTIESNIGAEYKKVTLKTTWEKNRYKIDQFDKFVKEFVIHNFGLKFPEDVEEFHSNFRNINIIISIEFENFVRENKYNLYTVEKLLKEFEKRKEEDKVKGYETDIFMSIILTGITEINRYIFITEK